MRGDTGLELLRANLNAFAVLYVVAQRSRWKPGFHAEGLELGEALLGDFERYGMTRQQYRTALRFLATRGFVTIRATSRGTVARLVDSTVFEIGNADTNQPINQRLTTDQPTGNQRVTTNEVGKKEEGKTETFSPPPLAPGESEQRTITSVEPNGQRKYTPDFEEFWKVYPKKVAKAEAFRQWKLCAKARPPLEQIVAAVVRQAQSPKWREEGGQFIPDPERWLKKGRWEDEVAASATAQRGPTAADHANGW